MRLSSIPIWGTLWNYVLGTCSIQHCWQLETGRLVLDAECEASIKWQMLHRVSFLLLEKQKTCRKNAEIQKKSNHRVKAERKIKPCRLWSDTQAPVPTWEGAGWQGWLHASWLLPVPCHCPTACEANAPAWHNVTGRKDEDILVL